MAKRYTLTKQPQRYGNSTHTCYNMTLNSMFGMNMHATREGFSTLPQLSETIFF